jgi:hypothetical protein
VLEIHLGVISIPENRNFELFDPLPRSDDGQRDKIINRRNIALLLQTMDTEIFSDFRKNLDSSQRDHYMVIDFRTL